MIHVVLYEPEIPPNTGNIIRLCANSGAQLHLIEPMGFRIDEAKLKRAGLDYHEFAQVKIHQTYDDFLEAQQPKNIYACSTKGKKYYHEASFCDDNDDAIYLLFGPETRGLPSKILQQFPDDKILKIPMQPNSRSLNLSNAVAIILYEAWRQMGFR